MAVFRCVGSLPRIVRRRVNEDVFGIRVVTSSIVPTVAKSATSQLRADTALVFRLCGIRYAICASARAKGGLVACLGRHLYHSQLRLENVVRHAFRVWLFLCVWLASLLLRVLSQQFVFYVGDSPNGPQVSLFRFGLTNVRSVLLCGQAFSVSRSQRHDLTQARHFRCFVNGRGPCVTLVIGRVDAFRRRYVRHVYHDCEKVPLLHLLLFRRPRFRFFRHFTISTSRFRDFRGICVDLRPRSSPHVEVLIRDRRRPLFIHLYRVFFREDGGFLHFFLLSNFVRRSDDGHLHVR